MRAGRENESLKNIKDMVKGVRELGMEACVTLGMIDGHQAQELKEAGGLTAYNHNNVDTSREHYPNVITTRSYDERLATIQNGPRCRHRTSAAAAFSVSEEQPKDFTWV